MFEQYVHPPGSFVGGDSIVKCVIALEGVVRGIVCTLGVLCANGWFTASVEMI
jgi:hypothetical protein